MKIFYTSYFLTFQDSLQEEPIFDSCNWVKKLKALNRGPKTQLNWLVLLFN